MSHRYPDPTGASVPVDVLDAAGARLAGVTQIAIALSDASEATAGSDETCPKTVAGKLFGWGDGRYGALGTQAVESSNVPLEIPGLEL